MRITFKGSITIFMALLLTSIMALSGAVLEILRYSGMKNVIIEAENNGAHSLLSNYDQKLWKKYHIYGLESSHPVLQSTRKYIQMGIEKGEWSTGVDFYLGNVKNVAIQGIQKITDDEGEDFYQQAIRYEKIHMPQILMDQWKDYASNQYEKAHQVSEEEIIQSSQNATERLKDNKWEEEKGEPVHSEEAEEYKDLKNPVGEYCNQKKGTLTQQVLGTECTISQEVVPTSCVKNWNEMEKGTYPVREASEDGMVNRLLFAGYLTEHFSSLVHSNEDGKMHYQLEYILSGKEKESEALETTLVKMKWLRIGVNYLYLLTSAEQMKKATAYAVALVGFTGIQPLIEAVKLGILFVWSYSEAIKELKCLAAGKKIPIIKTDQNFRTDLKQLFVENGNCNWDQEKGFLIDYTQMVQIFLLMENSQTQRLRAIHCMNYDLWNENKMDQFCTKVNLKVDVQFSNIFQCLSGENEEARLPYHYERDYTIGYLQKNK